MSAETLALSEADLWEDGADPGDPERTGGCSLSPTLDEWAASLPPVTFTVDSLLCRGMLTGLAAAPGGGKSFTSLALAACVASNTAFAGLSVTQGPVLYIALEGAVGRKLDAEKLGILGRGLPIALREPPRDCSSLRAWIADEESRINPVLTVLDTIDANTIGVDMNTSPAGALVKSIQEVAEARQGRAMLALFHSSTKTNGNVGLGRLLGHTSIGGALDGVFMLDRDDDDVITLTRDKHRAEHLVPRKLTVRRGLGIHFEAVEPAVSESDRERVLVKVADMERKGEPAKNRTGLVKALNGDSKKGRAADALFAAIKALLKEGALIDANGIRLAPEAPDDANDVGATFLH